MSYLEIDLAKASSNSSWLDAAWGSENFVAEEKLDGWRYAMHFGSSLSRVFLSGRRVSQTTGLFSEKGLQVPDVWPSEFVRTSLGYTVIDGEVLPPEGALFHDLAGIMNCDLSTAKKRIAEIGSPSFWAFDLLFLDGTDMRNLCQKDRRTNLEAIVGSLGNPLIQLVPQLPPKRSEFDSVLKRGGEGLILKDQRAPYGTGWIKAKKEFSLDVIVTGFTEAKFGRTGKFFGQVGAAVVSVYGSDGTMIEVAQVSGMDDSIRLNMTNHRSDWIGSVIEISAQEWAKTRLRHPRFVRRRPDADPKSCTFEKMMHDLRNFNYEEDQRQQTSFEF